MTASEPMVRLRAEAKLIHHGQRLVRGDSFVTNPREAEDLICLHFASLDTTVEQEKQPSQKPPSKKPRIQNKAEKAAPSGNQSKTGRYQRRDLRSED